MTSKMNPLMRHVLERDGWRCHYCKLSINVDVKPNHPRRATMDHMKPRSKGGSNKPINLVASCALCNQTKGDMPYDAFTWYRHMKARGETHEDLIAAIQAVCGPVRTQPIGGRPEQARKTG